MKTFYIIIIAMLALSGARAQSTNNKFNQVELMKQFIGTWKSEMVKDTTFIWECKLFGDALEFNIKSETKGQVKDDGKSFMGYDKKNDKLIEAVITNDSPEISLCQCWFTSRNMFEEIMLKDTTNPEKAILKWAIEFKSPDLFVLSEIKNNKTTFSNNFHREK